MTNIETLINARKAFVIAPAGCGKTQLIVDAVKATSVNHNLILTHTHAGIDVLKNRLKSVNAEPSRYDVDTIAGWSLRLALAFPETSGIKAKRPTQKQWNEVYEAAVRLLSLESIKSIVKASFGSVFVDEYQDCSVLQHEIILKLADVVPVRILGDPLQGIFNFNDTAMVDWAKHVEPAFQELSSLNIPHRWVKKNPRLGSWLQGVRKNIEQGRAIDIREAPESVYWLKLPKGAKEKRDFQWKICMEKKCKDSETLLAIMSWEKECHSIARRSGGKYRSPETIECKDLFTAVKAFDQAENSFELAEQAFTFADLCLTNINSIKKTVSRLVEGHSLQEGRKYSRQEQLDAVISIITTNSFKAVHSALLQLACMPRAKKARDELFYEMLNVLREYELGCYSCLEEAAVVVRERTRRIGRTPGRYVVSRTLLVKGLEFDHVIILDANALDSKNLYVALTRASRSLTVLSESPVLSI